MRASSRSSREVDAPVNVNIGRRTGGDGFHFNGLIDEVRMDVVPVALGSGKRYFGSVHAQHLLEEPDVVIQGNRVLHLRYRVRR